MSTYYESCEPSDTEMRRAEILLKLRCFQFSKKESWGKLNVRRVCRLRAYDYEDEYFFQFLFVVLILMAITSKLDTCP